MSDLPNPVHCFSCGAVLVGGATKHLPDCGLVKLVEKHFADSPASLRDRAVRAIEHGQILNELYVLHELHEIFNEPDPKLSSES